MINVNEKFNNRHYRIQWEFCHALHLDQDFSSTLHHRQRQGRVRMLRYSLIHTNSSFSSSTVGNPGTQSLKNLILITCKHFPPTELHGKALSRTEKTQERDLRNRLQKGRVRIFSWKGQRLCIRAHITLFSFCISCILIS